MIHSLATCLIYAAYAYGAAGILLLPWWHLRGLRRLDAGAGVGPWGFRVVITPGLIALWPWLLARARHGTGHPHPERNAHRDAASEDRA